MNLVIDSEIVRHKVRRSMSMGVFSSVVFVVTVFTGFALTVTGQTWLLCAAFRDRSL